MNNELMKRLIDGETMVFGHRGASAYAPENTITAYELAYQQGADGVELDVVLSADKHPMIIHNFSLDMTTNGQGLVTEHTLAELMQLDAGAWKGDQFARLRIPTLSEVFESVGQKLYINVEIKSDFKNIYEDVEEIVATTIREHDMTQRVIVSSFDPAILQRFREVAPEIPIGFLTHPETEKRLGVHLVEADAIHPYHEMINTEYMSKAKQTSQVVNTWTVNDPNRAMVLEDLGVGVIITDCPDLIVDALAK